MRLLAIAVFALVLIFFGFDLTQIAIICLVSYVVSGVVLPRI